MLSERTRSICYCRKALSAGDHYPFRPEPRAGAQKRFARLEGIRDWRDHAKIIEVSIIEDDPSLGVSRR
jgi:hypothetical protein